MRTTCAGVGTWASAVWARMAKKKDGTANMQKRETLRIGGCTGNSWEDLAEIRNSGITCFQILRGATALESSPGRSKTVPVLIVGRALGTQVVLKERSRIPECWQALGIKIVRSSPSLPLRPSPAGLGDCVAPQ